MAAWPRGEVDLAIHPSLVAPALRWARQEHRTPWGFPRLFPGSGSCGVHNRVGYFFTLVPGKRLGVCHLYTSHIHRSETKNIGIYEMGLDINALALCCYLCVCLFFDDNIVAIGTGRDGIPLYEDFCGESSANQHEC
jgi:hypothetical protein